MKKTSLSHLTNIEVLSAAQSGSVLLLPIGTVESNGPHQLLGCDFIIAEKLALAVAARTNALVMPTLHYGLSEMHDSLPGTFTLSEPLFSQLVETVVREAVRNGFTKIVMFNCHRQNIQPLEIIGRKMRREALADLALLDPLEITRDVAGEAFKGDGKWATGHGGEPLMSLIAHLQGDDIRLDARFPPGLNSVAGLQPLGSSKFAFKASKVGLFPLSREVNASGAWADVTNSSAERGQVAFNKLCDYVVEFVEMFGTTDILSNADQVARPSVPVG